MLAFILFLVILWIAFAIVGFVVKGLFWLVIVAVVLFIATMIFGGTRLRSGKR